VLVRRCGYLVDVHGVAPSAILAVTFTNKAAREMRERLAKLLGQQRASRIAMRTFHLREP
jgi:DNA helicase II / ATP-dependent DNA helicase PcrA